MIFAGIFDFPHKNPWIDGFAVVSSVPKIERVVGHKDPCPPAVENLKNLELLYHIWVADAIGIVQ